MGRIREIKRRNGDEGIGGAIDQAIGAMPPCFVIRPFLEAHRAKVRGMLLAERDEAERLALVRDNAWREGQSEGILETLVSLVKDGILSVKDASLRAGVPETTFKQIMTS